MTQRIARYDNPRDRILGLFDLLGEVTATPAYRGCAFINASAEGPRGETKVTQVCADSRAWVRDLFTELARDFGAAIPGPRKRSEQLSAKRGALGVLSRSEIGAASTAS